MRHVHFVFQFLFFQIVFQQKGALHGHPQVGGQQAQQVFVVRSEYALPLVQYLNDPDSFTIKGRHGNTEQCFGFITLTVFTTKKPCLERGNVVLGDGGKDFVGERGDLHQPVGLLFHHLLKDVPGKATVAEAFVPALV